MDVGCDFIFDFLSKFLNFSFLQNRLFQKINIQGQFQIS